MPGPIHTRRLRLVACTLDMARAAIAGDVGRLLDVEVVSTWPEEGLRGFLPIYARQLEADSAVLGWGIWLVVHSAHGVLIGDAGFKGQPNDAGQVEIGYSVVERYRGHGYATEAAMPLIEWAF